MTIEEINKIHQFLDSKDEELQMIGLVACGFNIPEESAIWFKNIDIRKAKALLANQAYLLGKLEGLKLLNNGGKYIENQSDASI